MEAQHFKELVESRRSIYEFAEVQDEVRLNDSLDEAIAAAHWAPCHHRTFPWRFYTIGPTTRNALVPVVKKIIQVKCLAKGMTDDETKEKTEHKLQRFSKTPGLLFVSTRKSPQDPLLEEEDRDATCCAIQNLTLSLWSQGIGSQWSSGPLLNHQETRGLLAVPEDEELIALIKYGVPSRIHKGTRPDVKKFISNLP